MGGDHHRQERRLVELLGEAQVEARLGGFVEIRTIMEEELERAFQGQQTAEQALANATTRGNVVLRNFQRANRG